MSFIYPRTITITRPGAQPAAVGDQGEAPSADPSLETPLASGLPASIQARNAGGKNSVGLPADGANQTWRVMIPKSAAGLGTIQNRDIVTDDLGNRYQVVADYWNSLGYNLITQRLEV